MSNREIIVASDIKLAKSVIGILDGSESFTICNKYFKDKCGLYSEQYDDISKRSTNSSEGFRLRSPRIAFKNERTGTFNTWAIIAWRGESTKFGKQYYIMNPGEERFKNLYRNCHFKLIVSPNDRAKPFEEEEEKLVGFDYQIMFTIECLLLATGFGIDLTKYAGVYDNQEFLTKFRNDIFTKFNYDGSANIEVENLYVDSFNNPPYYKTLKNRSIITVSKDTLNSNKPLFNSLYQNVRQFYMDECPDHTFVNDFDKVFDKENSVTMPSFRKIVIQDKKDKSIMTVRFDSRLDFAIKIKEGEPGYNPRIKDTMVTKRQVSSSKAVLLDSKSLFSLWGGSEMTPQHPTLRGDSHVGCLFIMPQIELKYYHTGHPTIGWKVDKLALKKRPQISSDNSYGGELFKDEDEDDEMDDIEKAFEKEDAEMSY